MVFYIFAMVGMELFKHKVKFYEDSNDSAKAYCGNPLLNNTAFAQLSYCKNNFNNVVSSFILLVELTVVNQWHDILYEHWNTESESETLKVQLGVSDFNHMELIPVATQSGIYTYFYNL